jgi:NADP-dependent 3-hydroxy acid dehydrogenase YdfG
MTRTWLITGTTPGLSSDLAETVLGDDRTLVATARTPEQLAELVARHPDRVLVALDITDRAELHPPVAMAQAAAA